jgi:serine/threonine protein kinase
MNLIVNEELKGGEAIASGGFGCVFKPALRCKNGVRTKNKVTKLMSTKHAIKEYEFIQNVKSKLGQIPNYENYFLVDDFEICEPDDLDESDMKNFDEKCSALKKHSKLKSPSRSSSSKMSVKYLNEHLDDVRALNMPDGGIDLENHIKEHNSKKDLLKANNALIDLLLHGIVPMNKKHVYHCDIKDTNIMIKDNHARLIDWGLSLLEKSGLEIPHNLYRRPFQYNTPFSSILFTNDFLKMYQDFLDNDSADNIRGFVIEYILYWNKERGSGHLNTINNMIKELKQNDKDFIISEEELQEYPYAYFYIVNYIVKILETYTKNKKFLLFDYLNDVFLKNIDLWGFVMTYISFFEHFDKIKNKDPMDYEVMEKIRNIIFKLFDFPTKHLDPEEIAVSLKELNNVFKKMNDKTKRGGKRTKRKISKKKKTRKLLLK